MPGEDGCAEDARVARAEVEVLLEDGGDVEGDGVDAAHLLEHLPGGCEAGAVEETFFAVAEDVAESA